MVGSPGRKRYKRCQKCSLVPLQHFGLWYVHHNVPNTSLKISNQETIEGKSTIVAEDQRRFIHTQYQQKYFINYLFSVRYV